MDKKTVKAFFNNNCTPKEAEKVLEWLDTPEGKAFLSKEMDKDQEDFPGRDVEQSELDSEKLFRRIEAQMPKEAKVYSYQSKMSRFTAFTRVAAVLVLIALSAMAVYQFGFNEKKEEPQVISKTFETGAEKMQELTLNDGTKIRLNNHSKIEVLTGTSSTREVKLQGEAFFEVARDEDHPFIIHAKETNVRVLGTSFNVKSDSSERNVQVAVREGTVSVEHQEKAKPDSAAKVVITAGDFAYVDLDRAKIDVEKAAVSNYWSWIDQRFSFDDASLEDVSRQLSRIYHVNFKFNNTNLKTKKLSADFERKSLEKTLSVISITLDIKYSRTTNTITWSEK